MHRRRHTCTVQAGDEVEPVRGNLLRPVDEVSDCARRVVKPRPRGDASLGRERKREILAAGDVDLGVDEYGVR